MRELPQGVVLEVARAAGLEALRGSNDRKMVVRCPVNPAAHKNGDKHPSGYVDGERNIAGCSTCNETLTAKQLAERHGVDWPTILSKTMGDAPRAPAQVKPPTLDPAAVWEALERDDAEGRAYLERRGIHAPSQLVRFATPSSPGPAGAHARNGFRLAVPIRDADGQIVAVQLRRLDAGEDRFRSIGPTSAGVFGYPRDVATSARVVVAEGLTDFLAAANELGNAPDVCVISIAGVNATNALKRLPLAGKSVYLAHDADGAGDQGAADLAGVLAGAGASVYRARPTAGKDLVEHTASGGKVADLLDTAPRIGPEPPKPAEPRRFELVAVNTIPEIVTQEWLIEGLIPTFDEGAAGYVFGPAKARKSMLLSDFALSVATGTPALGKYEVRRRGAVVGFFAEDPKSESSRRIHRLARGRGVDVPSNLMLINTPSIAIDSPEHQAMLLDTLTAVPDLALVWLDPMVRLHRVNDNKAEELGPIHTFLRTMSRQLPHAVLLLAHHANKEGDSRGSTDYNAFGDFNLYLRKKDRLTTEVVNIENRGGPPGEPFAFSVEDGFIEGVGATMKVIPHAVDDGDEEADDNVRGVIARFIEDHPSMGFGDAKKMLRKSGLTFGNDLFSEVWKTRRKGE